MQQGAKISTQSRQVAMTQRGFSPGKTGAPKGEWLVASEYRFFPLRLCFFASLR
jgi:hypothetical protein